MKTPTRDVDAAPRLSIYEVNEQGTLSAYGVEPPSINRDIYPCVELDASMSTDQLIAEIENIPPLVALVQDLAEEALVDMRSDLEEQNLAVTERTALRAVVSKLDKAGDLLWKVWMQRLEREPLRRLRKEILDWPNARIDWRRVDDFSSDWGPQGKALSDFSSLTEETLISIGVQIVYAEHPGSTYHAAELRSDIDEANAQAEQIGLDVRFVREGESAERFTSQPCHIRDEATVVDLAKELQGYFVPTFGVRPNLRLGRPPGLAASATVPPRDLASVHNRELFDSAWGRIVQAIRDPVHVWVDAEDRRHVQVLGIGVYSFDDVGLMTCHIWKADLSGRQGLVRLATRQMTIDHVPWRFVWLGAWERAFALEVEAALSGANTALLQEKASQYARWAFSVFQHRVRRGCDLRVMRQRIARELDIDPLVLSVARQAARIERKTTVTAETCNRVISHLDAHRKLASDAPRLALCFDMLSQLPGFTAHGEPLERIRAFLVRSGLSQRCWRMLVKSGPALWRPMAQFYDKPGPAAALDFLRLVDRLGWHEPAHPAFMRTVLSMRGGPGGDRSGYSNCMRKMMPSLRRIVGWFERTDASTRTDMLKKLHMVMGWLDDGGWAEIAKVKRPPGWATLVRKANSAWQRRLTLQMACSPTWGVPQERVAIEEFEVCFIGDVATLLDEGLSMRHCIFDYATDCAKGDRLVASVRHTATGKRVATALYRTNGRGWALEAIAGFANGEASGKFRALAASAAAMLQAVG